MFVDLLDELGAGLAPVSAADIRDELGLAYGGVALVLLVAPLLLSMLIEGPLLLVSDRWRRDRMAGIGMFVMGLGMLVAAQAQSAWVFALALGVWATASGVACGVSQAALMDANPDERERWMTRWTLLGSIGDTLAPVLVLGGAALGLGWRGALTVAGVMHLVHAVALARAMQHPRFARANGGSDPDDEEEIELSLGQRIRAGLRDRELLAWLIGSTLCILLDELFVAFGALFLRDELGADVATQTVAFTICAIAGVLGLAACDWLLRRVDPLRLLLLASIGTSVAFVAWLHAGTIVGSIIALALLGVFVAPLYPICAARAYAARPGEAGLVAAVDQLFTPFAIAAPLLLGLIADRFGVVAALTCLLLQPLGVGLLAARALLRRRSGL